MEKYSFKGEEGLEIVSLEKLTTNSLDLIEAPHRVDFYQIYHFTNDTQGVLEVNFEKIQLRPNTILFVPSDVVCSFSRQSVYRGHVIIFTDFFAKKSPSNKENLLFTKLFQRFRKPILYDVKNLPISQLINLMQLEIDAPNLKHSQLILLNYLGNIIAYSERLVKSNAKIKKQQKPQQRLIVRFYDLINANYQNQQKLQFYCDKLGVKHAELSQATTQLIGVTPKTLINQKIVLEAKSFLAYTNLSIKQICYKVGLNEPSYFTTFFRKYEGCSPKAFRKKYKEFK